MGAADVVPGVSGGTIAFITGIYDNLIQSLRLITPGLLYKIKQDGLKNTLHYVNAPFLTAILLGILTSIFSLAQLVTWLLAVYPIPLWSFFFGLIIISTVHILKQIKHFSFFSCILILLGGGFAYTITIMHPLAISAVGINIVLGGAIAICAMILPGISGSFILLLLGLYSPILEAIKNLNLEIMALFALGALLGLLSFSHLLSFLLKNYKSQTFCVLVGLMLGTLGKIWPWKEVVSWRINSHGKQVPFLEHNLLPSVYEQVTGNSSQLILACCFFVIGILIIYLLEKTSRR